MLTYKALNAKARKGNSHKIISVIVHGNLPFQIWHVFAMLYFVGNVLSDPSEMKYG